MGVEVRIPGAEGEILYSRIFANSEKAAAWAGEAKDGRLQERSNEVALPGSSVPA